MSLVNWEHWISLIGELDMITDIGVGKVLKTVCTVIGAGWIVSKFLSLRKRGE